MTKPAQKKTSPRKTAAKPPVKAGTSKEAAADRKAKFVEAYIANGGNATDAAKKAGYSQKTARQQAARLLSDVAISSAIAERQKVLAEKHELTTDSVIAELSKIVHADPRKLFNENGSMLPVHEWPDGMAGAVASVEVVEITSGEENKVIGYTKKLKLWDKNSAIDKAMKHLGLFAEDNKQKASALADLPRDVVKAIHERLKQLNAGNRS